MSDLSSLANLAEIFGAFVVVGGFAFALILDWDGADPDRLGDQPARKPIWIDSPGPVDADGSTLESRGTAVIARSPARAAHPLTPVGPPP
jgi:hypothetical protein